MSRTISNAIEKGADTNMWVVMPLTTNLMSLSTVPSSGTILPEARGTSTVCIYLLTLLGINRRCHGHGSHVLTGTLSAGEVSCKGEGALTANC